LCAGQTINQHSPHDNMSMAKIQTEQIVMKGEVKKCAARAYMQLGAQ